MARRVLVLTLVALSGLAFSGSEKIMVPKMPYLLYDVKLGEGFNLQKEVFIRAGMLIDALPGNWTLVLPPWCWLAHWNVNPQTSRRPWGDFFASEFMRQKGVPVIEYSTYTTKVKGPGVDHTIFLDYLDVMAVRGKWEPWHEEVPCKEISEVSTQQHFTDESGGELSRGKVQYSGMCDPHSTFLLWGWLAHSWPGTVSQCCTCVAVWVWWAPSMGLPMPDAGGERTAGCTPVASTLKTRWRAGVA
jgi:hypothetical protein